MNDVCMFTQSMTPNQISAASAPTTGVRIFCAIGAIIGRMMKAISKKSTVEPSYSQWIDAFFPVLIV